LPMAIPNDVKAAIALNLAQVAMFSRVAPRGTPTALA
jgi:hypothetical protein